MKSIVLGSTSLIGANLVRQLRDAGSDTIAAVRRTSDPAVIRALGVPYLSVVYDDPLSVQSALSGRDLIFYCRSWRPDGPTFRPNEHIVQAVRSLRTVLETAMRLGQRVIFLSCCTTLAREAGARMATERGYYLPGSVPDPHFEAQWLLECEALRYATHGLNLSVLIPGFVIGPYDAGPSNGQLILDIATDRLPFEIDGEINVIHAADVAHGAVAAAAGADPGERLILAGENIPVPALFSLIRSALGKHDPGEPLAPPFARLFALGSELWSATFGEERPALSRTMLSMFEHGLFLDGSRGRERLAMPQTAAATAVVDAITWFRANGQLP